MLRLPQRLSSAHRRSRVALYALILPVLAAFTFAGALDSAKRFIYIFLGFSLIIFLHELGHFVVARLCSVKCLAFSIGIGPRMCGWRKGGKFNFGKDPYDPDAQKDLSHKSIEETEGAASVADLPQSSSAAPHPAGIGDTDYRISWLPLGGYVRMLGQDDMDPTKVSNDPRAFNQRPVWQRMLIVSAGVTMNLIFAAVTFAIIFSPGIGVNFPPAHMGLVAYNSPAEKAGLTMGDEIVAINHKRDLGFVEFTDVQIACALSSGSAPINFAWDRPQPDGTVKRMSADIIPVRPPDNGFLMIGVSPMPSLNIANSQDQLDESVELRKKPLAEGGDDRPEEAPEIAKLKPHDHIVAVDGTPVSDYVQFYDLVQKLGSQPVHFKIHNDDAAIADRTITIRPQLELRQAVGTPGSDEYPLVAGMGPRLIALKVEKGPAKDAGMRDGDIITRIGDRSQPSLEDLFTIVGASAGNTVPFDVLRDGKTVTLQVQVERTKTGGKIQVAPAQDLQHPDVSVRDPDAAPHLDMLEHDRQARITAVDGTPVKSWEDIYGVLRRKSAGDKVTLTFASDTTSTTAPAAASESAAAATAPGEQTASITVSPELATALAQRTHYIADIPVEVETRTQRADTAWGAVVMGAQHTWKFIEQVYMTLLGLVRGTVDPSNLHGIVGITKVGYDIQQRGPVWLWYLLAMVSVNLAVANFLPLPIVDGGLFLLLILEKIRGRPLSLKVQSAIQIVGIVLLAGLFLFVTYNDIWLVFTGK